MELLQSIWDQATTILNVTLFPLQGRPFTLGTFLHVILLFALLIAVVRLLKNRVLRRLLERTSLNMSARQATSAIFGYVAIAIGLVIVLQSVGIDLTTLNVLAGAIGIGVGFGLQNVASNFISGLIILFERPIKVGDRIEVGGIEGDVVAINARSTTVTTNDNISIIIPNSSFVEQNVINWSYSGRQIRFRIPVGVAYGSDTRLVERLLIQAARENPNVLDDPSPAVRFLAFGDNALEFELRAWTEKLVHRKGRLTSELNFAIADLFEAHGIEVPFPQRDLHIRTLPESLTDRRAARSVE